MDREPEDLRFLGILGITEEAFKILRSCAKLLGSLVLSFVLPLSFAILGGQFLIQQAIFNWKAMPYLIDTSRRASERITKELTFERAELLVILAAYAVSLFIFSLLSTAAVVYTAASIYASKEISYRRVMSIVLRVWKRLMETFLWFFIIVFAYCALSALLCFQFVCTVVLFNWNLAVLKYGMYVITVGFVCGYVCLSVVFHLACVISVLEDKYGRAATRKSANLIQGKQITAMLLDILYLIFAGIIGWLFAYTVLQGDRHGLGSAGIGVCWTVLVGLLCFVNLMGFLTQTVFYFVCKSYHHEIIDKSSLSDHLEGYLVDYERLRSSNVQMEGLDASL